MRTRPIHIFMAVLLITPLGVATNIPGAAAAFTPSKTSSVTVTVDGVTLGIDDSVSDMSGTRSGVFGGAMSPLSGSDPGTGELTEMYAAKDGSFVNFEAKGGIVAMACSGGGTTHYRRAQVTIGSLPSGTNDVWVLSDAEVGPRVGPTPQFNDTGTMVAATGTSGSADITVSTAAAATISVGDQVVGNGIGALAAVTAVNAGTGVLTLSINNSGTVSGNVTIYKERIGTTSGMQELCDASTPYIAGATGTTVVDGVLTLGDSSASPSTARDTAGVVVDNTTASSVSFDIYVPTNGSASGSTENFIALGIVVDAGGTGSFNDGGTDDTAIFTHVVSRPWDSAVDLLLTACSSPSATADPCYIEADTGIFQADGTTRIGGTSQFAGTASLIADSGQDFIDAAVAFTTAHGDGFATQANSIVKMSLSLPTSGTVNSIDFAASDFATATGQTGLLVDPRTTSSSSATNRWDITTPSSRVLVSITGQARETSSAISRSTWYGDCQISISGSTVSTTGCGEGMTSSVSSGYMVFSSVPSSFQLIVIADPVMATIAGGLVSTNAQEMNFGAETMAGTSFQFAVAGPSYTFNNVARSTDGFYYVCVPSAFLSGSFATTVSAAVTDWVGTRDGVAVGTSFDSGNCATSAGLVAYLDPYGYSAPLFSLAPRSTPAPSGDSGSSSQSSTVVTTTEVVGTQSSASQAPTAQAPVVTPAITPAIYPSLSVGKSVKAAYVKKLANYPKSYRVKLSIPKMYRSVCRIKDGKVKALKAGVCGVRVKAVTSKGVSKVKRVYLTIP